MAKAKVFSAEKSAKGIRVDAAKLAKATNIAWSIAKKTPLFLRRPKFIGNGKSKVRATMVNRNGIEVPIPQRKNRCLRTSTIKTLLSGAAASENALLKEEGEILKTTIDGEFSVAAALPKMSEGAELEFEHALCAFTQSIFDTSVRIKNGMGLHAKVSIGCMLAAAEIVNTDVFASSSLCPGTIVVDTKRRVVKPKQKKQTVSAEAPSTSA